MNKRWWRMTALVAEREVRQRGRSRAFTVSTIVLLLVVAAGVAIPGAVFLVLGYAFYCTAFAAAGSLVSRQSDVGTVILPVQIPLIVAYALSYTVIYANGANVFYRVLGFLPPTAPVAMPVLYAAGDVPTWQVVISAVLCAAGTVWMARVAALIYGRSILRTGSRVRLREVLGSQPAA